MVKEWITKEMPSQGRPISRQGAYWVRLSPFMERPWCVQVTYILFTLHADVSTAFYLLPLRPSPLPLKSLVAPCNSIAAFRAGINACRVCT